MQSAKPALKVALEADKASYERYKKILEGTKVHSIKVFTQYHMNLIKFKWPNETFE